MCDARLSIEERQGMSREFAEEYESHLLAPLSRLQDLLQDDLRKKIEDAGLVIHSLGGRVKSRSSVERKLARPDRTYRDLLEVTDLLAFRIVTYSEDVIAEVARVVENAFEVDFEHSVNKLHHEDSQRFGYRSLHYVCSLPQERGSGLGTYASKIRFEVQIRTVLQHTWAEIEHDVGYKAAEQLPREFRRRFSQIASLLEVADREFAAIRTDLKNYETKLKSADFRDDRIELDHLSLQSILERGELEAWDREIAGFMKVSPSGDPFYPDYLLRALRASGLKRVGDILGAAPRLKSSLLPFLPIYFGFAEKQLRLDLAAIPSVQKGYGLLFLAHLHLLDVEDLLIDQVSRMAKFYGEMDYPNDPGSAKAAAQALIAALKAGRHP
jgi:ppGpp synthetase/RelA/SpoT-type nucleotidyltranferase